MLGGSPSRVPQPADRQNVYRQETVRRQSDEPRQQHVEPQQASSHPQQPPMQPHQKKSKSFMKPLVVAVIILLAVLVGWFAWQTLRGGAVAIDNSKHQAVFFSSGQVYFGKLEVVNADYMRLTDVFYIQSGSSDTGDSENPQESSGSSMELIKLGEEVHGPEDEMIINRDQMLFFENLKSDGKVSQLIKDYKSSNN